jgi:hypothetical protein
MFCLSFGNLIAAKKTKCQCRHLFVVVRDIILYFISSNNATHGALFSDDWLSINYINKSTHNKNKNIFNILN